MTDFNGSDNCAERVNHIRCEVSSCAYNDQKKCCTASMIEVAPDCGGSSCSCDSDTCCRTYQRA